MTKVTTEEIEKRLAGGEDLTIVDSRAPKVWDEADVKAAGAMRVPPDEPEKQLANIRKDAYVVTYCT